MAVLNERARAKVNLTLHVLGRRADGYHDLESLVAFADCADGLTFSPRLRLLALRSPDRAPPTAATSPTTSSPRLRGCLGERVPQLTVRRLRARQASAGGRRHRWRLGRRRSDAAAARGRQRRLRSDDPRVIAAAQAAGADVPVCLLSSGCMMRGAGEKVTPMPLPRLPCVLINPGVPVPTKDVFAAIGLKAGDTFTPPSAAQRPWRGRTPLQGSAAWLAAIRSGRNDLEPVAVKIQPVIAEVLSLLADAKGCTLSRMSGSGATCFGLFDSDASAASAAASLKSAHPKWWVEASALS